ncbi:MAG: T9SS type A sorting domain-containing protein [Ignavibacteriaceae bacterium]|nr:T9SS type A sorting domain-containing protein [Ignavibacterium sp.]MCC6253805.1 T9SS type A sorting domain-containing protein [Ignavibacteriaceae bacterium]HRN25150.1 T9SS type A sorting domain-containing protein [Ignavibacteriaceae bacterium]HRP92312.1 T9SS type A sorting domain-containing protein [Ignavibacteriaceae bacterium]HRQ53370.1 T9SS type A sorting domain-containing protein [Ignavibacteriaceae bacterium]
MKYIIRVFLLTLSFTVILFSQEKNRVIHNSDDNPTNKFKEILKQTMPDFNDNKYENIFKVDAKDNQVREIFVNQQKGHPEFQNSTTPNERNILSKTLLDRFVVTENIYQTWDGTTWANQSKSAFVYDARDNEVQNTYQNWNTTVWENSSRNSSVYDANDNQTENIYQSWNGSAWVNNSKYIYTYDASNNQTDYLYQTWDVSVWKNNTRNVSTYDSNNKVTLRTYQNWNGTAWVNSYKYTYTYDSNRNQTQYDYQIWSGTAWTNDSRSTFTYNTNNKRTEQIYLTWNGTAWINNSKYTYTYDANNNQIEFLQQTWDVSVWKNSSKAAYTYNAHKDITELIYQNWDGTAWVNSYRYSLTYNAKYNLTDYLYQTWDLVVWKDNGKINLTYDANDNQTQQISQNWNGTAWVNQSKYSYTYTSGHYATTITLNTSYNFGDATKTTSYQIIGLPGANNIPISSIVSGTAGVNGDWRAFWDAGTGAFMEYNSSANFNFVPGKAFWVISKNTININQSVNTVTIASDNTYSIPVHSEWNLISNPLDKNISWNRIQNLNSITQPIHFYQNGSYSNPDGFEKYKGYYFFNATNLTTLKIPYSGSAFLPKQNLESQNELKISIYSNADEKASVGVGVSGEAKEGVDMLDVFAPPSQFSEVSISLINKNLETNYKFLQKDYRPEIGEGQEFDFIVKNLSDEDVDMVFSGINNFANNKIFLLDKNLWKLYDLSKINSFVVRKNLEKKEYSILIGTEDFILQKKADIMPTEFSLSQNYPNPFNPTTRIMFSLPQQSNVSLKVYNTLGQLAFEVINNQTYEAGYHEVVLDGSQLASGIYLYQLQTNSSGSKPFVETKKMILIK